MTTRAYRSFVWRLDESVENRANSIPKISAVVYSVVITKRISRPKFNKRFGQIIAQDGDMN
jgi:hypothetical protein